MLYQIHEFQRAAMTPFRLATGATKFMYCHPLNPAAYTQGGRALAAACELVEGALRSHGKPAFGIDTVKVGARSVAVAEEIVWRRPFCQLKRFRKSGVAAGPRQLIVTPLSGHYATLLRDTVRAMLPAHDVMITDWHDARDVAVAEGPFNLDDYTDYVLQMLRHLGPETHVMAVCQPSVPVLAATALMAAAGDPARPRTLTLMGGPVDTRINPTMPNLYAENHGRRWFDATVIQCVPFGNIGAGRRVYPGFLQLSGFLSMNLDRHVDAHLEVFNQLVRGDGDGLKAHRAFYDEYQAVMDLAADYFLETVERVFQRKELARGGWRHRGELARPEAIRDVALMTVEGEKDDISAVGQTAAAQALCSGLPDDMRGHHVQPGVGHYGVFNGRRWRSEIAPRIADFIARHSGGRA